METVPKNFAHFKQLASFPQRLLVQWWKTNDACRVDFLCQTSERMLAELGFEFTTLGFNSPSRYDLSYRNGSTRNSSDQRIKKGLFGLFTRGSV